MTTIPHLTVQTISNYAVALAVQVVTPSTGATVASDGSPVLIINNTGAILALTITMPASPVDGQRFAVSSRSSVTTFTMSGATIYGGLSSLLALSYAQFVYSATATAWFRIG